MLKAILHGKAGRISLLDGEPLSWRQVFRQREDLLTATIFGRFSYLSLGSQQKILGFLLTPELARLAGRVTEIRFWPRLNTQGISRLEHRTLVEPDLWLCCAGLNIVIEVKPPFGGEQYVEQWLAEALTVGEAAKQEGRRATPLALVALGNNQAKTATIAEEEIGQVIGIPFSLHLRNWPEFCYFFFSLRDSLTDTDHAVISDMIEAFSIFGLRRPAPEWMPLCTFGKHFDADLARINAFQQSRQVAKTSSPSTQPLSSFSTDWARLIEYCRANPIGLTHE